MSETFSSGFVRIDIRFVKHHAQRIGAPAVTVYLVLAAHGDAKTRQCFPSLRTISRLSKLSRPTVLKAIGKLEEERLIKVERGYRARGDREVNRYTLLPVTGGEPALPPVVNDVDYRGQAGLPEQDSINKNQKNKGERASGDGALAPSSPTRDPHLDHPAVQVYRGVCKLTPDETQRAAIAAAVADVARWQEVIRQWMLAGYRKQNVAGMLDWYVKGIPERSAGSGRHAKSGQFGFAGNRGGEQGRGRPPETHEDPARRDAEWRAIVTQSQAGS